MKIPSIHYVMATTFSVVLFAGCATKNDAVEQAEKSEKNAPGVTQAN